MPKEELRQHHAVLAYFDDASIMGKECTLYYKEEIMATKAPPPIVTVPIDKEDLFYALLRLFQLADDAFPLDSEVEEPTDSEADEDEATSEIDATEPDDDADEHPPPNHFQQFFSAMDTLIEKTASEYLDLFALLSTPLLQDPKLKAEFIQYAHDRNMDIVFIEDVVRSRVPKLELVPPHKEPTDDGGNKPPTT